ncbi:MAG TPA: hypothetical protein PKY77_16580 [Phycisphaerae bacterium]|nr:hypothetical protein [Phycisphaerae bacterium]HRY70755.1 hypothetical protein [Phycisphaerae bacterium]HSA28871.1 hypothetical protein [Phycisphaerae bacterium]
MSEALKNVDWDLLHRQKLTLLAMHGRQPCGSTEFEHLSGIIHLLDALQDDAADAGLWAFLGQHVKPPGRARGGGAP